MKNSILIKQIIFSIVQIRAIPEIIVPHPRTAKNFMTNHQQFLISTLS